ncbi:MAG: aminoacyl-tRNA hydrolase [Acidobacteria bacterium]|nr:aminoacyl-tRNA hydrolase [Acidobacteriota bacterium]MCI0719689.1 aminoacyl-tRNA hydrolase [Acidobacteriota bacterium]
MSSRKLVVGLGNPGSQYRHTPHNLGFEVLDRLALQSQATWVPGKCQVLLTVAKHEQAELVLVKPQTWMNLSGRAVTSALEYYGFAPGEFLIVCDDLALPFGKIRIRAKGRAGGHNGLRSIIESAGTNEFARVRLGVFPGAEIPDAAEYLLSPIGENFRELAESMVEQASNAVCMIALRGLLPAMNHFNNLSVPEKTEEI